MGNIILYVILIGLLVGAIAPRVIKRISKNIWINLIAGLIGGLIMFVVCLTIWPYFGEWEERGRVEHDYFIPYYLIAALLGASLLIWLISPLSGKGQKQEQKTPTDANISFKVTEDGTIVRGDGKCICSKCHSSVPTESTFCPSCGNKLK